jgi:rRNA maturation RNase YbeY
VTHERVARIARAVLENERVDDALLSITFVSTPEIRRLNRKHLRRAGATDVISFGFRPASRGAPVVGDVYVAPGVARTSAKANRVTVGEELTRLVVHGVLHVLGYEHPESETRTHSAMWRKQERLVARLMTRRR